MRWLAVVAGVAAIGLGGASRDQPQQVGGKAADATEQGAPPKPLEVIVTAPVTINDPKQSPAAQERERRDDEQSRKELGVQERLLLVAVVQAFISGLGLIGLVYTVIYAKGAYEAASKSAKADNDALEETRKGFAEARADAAEQAERFKKQFKLAEQSLATSKEAAVAMDRAWISVEASLAGPIVFANDEISVSIRFVMKNIGRSPAIGATRNFKLTAALVEEDSKIEQRLRWRRIHSIRIGFVLLPGAEIDEIYRLDMAHADFMAAIAYHHSIRENPPPTPEGIFPAIIAGVEYSLAGDEKGRATYMYYYLRRKADPPDFDGSPCTVSMDDLEMVSEVMAGPIR